MRLKVVPLQDVQSVNSFRFATEIKSMVGDPVELFFMLYDDEKVPSTGVTPSGLRYLPPLNSTLQVIFQNIDNAKRYSRFASQPFTQDASIWKIPVLATDPVAGTVSMKFILTETSGVGTITKTADLQANFLVDMNCPQVGQFTPVSY